jgi:carbamoyl-phosphate synthase small subunit
MGNLVLARACGGRTYKLPYGHRSHNQPCRDLLTNKCVITSQNHSYTVDPKTLPPTMKEYFVNVNDGSNEGLMHAEKWVRSVQFHPEACGGPLDTRYLFDDFVSAVRSHHQRQQL